MVFIEDSEFEAAVRIAFRADLEAKEAKERADEAREIVKQLIIDRKGKNYDGGTAQFHVVMYPTRRFNAALAAKKLDKEQLEAVSSMQVDRKLVDALLPKEFVQAELSTESAPTLKITQA